MTKKDVQLVVRAKNEASGALNSVSQSLSKLNKDLLENAKTGKTASSGMEELGNDVAQLASRLEGLRGIGTAAQALEKVKSSIEGMRGVLNRTAGEFVTFSREARQMQTSLASQRDEASRLSSTLDTQREAVRKAALETRKSSEAAKELTRAERALKAEQSKKNPNEGEIAKATQRYNQAKAAVDAYAATHKRLKAEQDTTADSLSALNGAIRQNETALNRLTSKRDTANQSARAQKTLIDETAQSYRSVSAEVEKTATSLGAMAGDQQQLAKATKDAEDALKRQEQTLKALQRYSTGGGTFADPKTAASLREQQALVNQAQQEWKSLEAEIRSQAGAMQSLNAPTQQQLNAQQQLIAAARQAKAEYREQANALKTLEVAARGVTSAYGQADAHVRAFNAELNRTPKSPPASGWRGFFNSIYGDSRKAMSMMQRLRGELLALGTAYVGLYGTINQVGGVITAYQQLEAAQNRLGVVFQQDGAAVRKELAWLERQAQRLGIEFGTLSDQYGKFAIAAQSANFSSEGTREVFLAVAEAGRVAKLSNDQLKGTFLALEQMISKGRIQSEELRQQLGERLPGAVSILARALGRSTAELAKMMELGQVAANEGTMLAFAEELNKQFGPQLATSLRSTSAEIGRFFNNIYQAQLQVANGGLIEGLTKGMAALDKWFRSREGRDFFLSLGAAAGRLLEVLAMIPPYFDMIGVAVKAIVALKLAQWFAGVVGGMTATDVAVTASVSKFTSWGSVVTAAGAKIASFRAGLATLSISLATIPARLTAMGTGFTLLAARATAARVSLTALNATIGIVARGGAALLAAFGGWAGIAAGAVAFIATDLIGRWLGGVEQATVNMDEHNRIVQQVAETYETLGKKTADWAKSVEGVTAVQAEGNYLTMLDAYNGGVDELSKKLKDLQGDRGLWRLMSDVFSEEDLRRVRAFIDEFDPQNFNPEDVGKLHDALLALNAEIDDVDAKKAVQEIFGLTEAAMSQKEALDLAAASVVLMGGKIDGISMTVEEATEIFEKWTAANKDASEAVDDGADSVSNYNEKMRELRELIPSVAAEMKKLQDYSKLDVASMDAARAALEAGRGIGGVLNDYAQGKLELDLANIDTTPLQNSLDKNSAEIKAFYQQIKGSANRWSSNPAAPGRATLQSAAWQNANLASIETASGIKTQVHKSAAAAFQGFINELEATGYNIRQFGGFNVRNKVGGNTLSEHSFGNAIDINWDMNPFADKLITDLPKDIGLTAAKYGLSWGGDWRNKKDAMHFEYTGLEAPGTDRASDFRLKQQQQTTQEMQKQREATAGTLADLAKQLDTEKLRTLGAERQLAVTEAYQKALKDNPGISAEELGKIAQLRGEIWDEENVTRVAKAEQEAFAALVEGTQYEIEQQELINAGKEREAFIENAIREAKEVKKAITDEEIAQIAELAGRQYDLQQAEKARTTALEAAEKRVNDLLEYRNTLQETMRLQMEQGDTTGAQQTAVVLEQVNAELRAAIDNAIAMWQAIGGPQADMAIAKLNQTKLSIQGTRQQMGAFGLSMQEWQGIAQNFASGLTGVFKKFAQAIGQGEDAFKAMGEAFMEFAANFLIQIGEMIIQKAIFNALGLGGGSGGGGGLLGGLIGFGHTGGVVGSKWIGSGNMAKSLPYFHDGGVVGLKPNETMAVLEKGEEVLTANDPRHMLNGGAMPSVTASAPSVKIVNAFDSGDVVSAGLETSVGEETFLNVIRRHSSTVRDIING